MKHSIFNKNNFNIHHEIETMIEIEHARIKAVAYNGGKHYGMQNPALPLTKGDKLMPYIRFKSSYEDLAIKVLQKLQPASQLLEGKMDTDMASIQKKRLVEDLEKAQKQIGILNHELEQFDPSELASRINKTNILGVGLFIGEVALNTQAFQITGANLLSTLMLSASVSLAVCLGAHFAGRKYKDSKTKIEKWLVILISAIGITIVSSVIASLRTIFLKRIGMDVNPIYFTVFNIFFFLITAFATWYLYPTKEEVEENRDKLQKFKLILQLEKEKKLKEKEIHEHEITKNEKSKEHLNSSMFAEYAIERIKKLYRESIDIFIAANRLGRKDNPDYLNDEIPSLDIPNINFESIINKYIDHENKNNNPAS